LSIVVGVNTGFKIENKRMKKQLLVGSYSAIVFKQSSFIVIECGSKFVLLFMSGSISFSKNAFIFRTI